MIRARLNRCLRSFSVCLFIGLFPFSAGVHAEDWDIILTSWFDNLSYGLPNTAIGAPIATAEMIGQGFVGFDATDRQLVLVGSNFPGTRNFSTGLIHHAPDEYVVSTDDQEAHEGGHAGQSAALGLGYFPMVLLDYAIERDTRGNVVEDWADAWRFLGKTMSNSRVLKLRLESGGENGVPFRRIGTNFVILERSSKLETTDSRLINNQDSSVTHVPDEGEKGKSIVTLSHRYGEVGISCATAQGDTLPIQIHSSLFEKDFIGEWATISSALRLLVDSHQETGKLTVDVEHERVDASFLKHRLGVGVRVNIHDKVAIDAIARGSYGLNGRWRLSSAKADAASPGIYGSLGYGYEGRIDILDQAQLYYRKTAETGTDGYKFDEDTIGVESPRLFSAETYTGANGSKGRATRLNGGISYSSEEETFSNRAGQPVSTRIRLWMFDVGGRF